jgi:hypothetical protein
LQELSLVGPSQQQLQRLFRCSSRRQQEQQLGQQQQLRKQCRQLLPCLTKLYIVRNGMEYHTSSTPRLYELSSLRCLDLRGAEVGSVQQLSALSRLESLTLHSVSTLVPHSSSDDSASDSTSSDTDSDSDSSSGSDGGDDSDSGSDAYTDRFDGQFNGQKHPNVADTGELLQLLSQLTRLTQLDLFGLAKPAAAVPQWACLGRCTGLQVLRLQHLFMHKDSWGLMFAGAELRKLRELRLTAFHTFGVMS